MKQQRLWSRALFCAPLPPTRTSLLSLQANFTQENYAAEAADLFEDLLDYARLGTKVANPYQARLRVSCRGEGDTARRPASWRASQRRQRQFHLLL